MGVPIIGASLSSLGFGLANIVIKKALAISSIPQTLIMSMAAGVLCLVPIIFIFGGEQLTSAHLATALLFGAGETALYMTLYKALEKADVSVAIALLSTYPLLSMFFAVVFLGESTNSGRLIATVMIVFGAILVSLDWRGVFRNGLQVKDLVKGFGWILICLLIHAVYFPALGDFTSEGSWSLRLTLVKIGAVIFLTLLYTLLPRLTKAVGYSNIQPVKFSGVRRVLPYTSLLGALEIIGWVGISWASNNSSGMIAVIVALGTLSPLVTAVAAYIWLREKLEGLQYLGIVVIVVGAILLALA